VGSDGPGVADVFRRAGQGFRERMAGTPDAIALEVMDCIGRCRTPALGGVAFRCTGCGHVHAVWKSCGNRHCPSCQGAAAHRWMDRQADGILPVPYFHVVLTLPRPVARTALQNRRTVPGILFRTAAGTLRTIGADPARFGARTGGTAVLHTWNQRMDWHPHLHCLVPNAGFDVGTGEWKVGSDRFPAPARVLASRFRRRFVEELAKAHADGRLAFHGSIAHLADPRAFAREMRQIRQTAWKVYAKRPFNGPEAVVRYLGRYTHRVAISDARILAFDGETVTFRWRRPVSKPGDRPAYGTMALTADGFIQRFLLHRIPKGFHRIRHFGILANGCRARTLQAVPDSSRRETPPETGDGAGTVEETRGDRPACPKCGAPSEPVLTLPERPGENPEDVLGPIRKPVRQRGPPRSGGAT